MSEHWSDIEVDLIIQDYFAMLADELKNIAVNKSEHRKKLIPLLNGRSHGSVEFKHQNISAVLAEMGMPFIRGYKPRYNFQRSKLISRVSDYLRTHLHLEKQFDAFVTEIPAKPIIDFSDWTVTPPEKGPMPKESAIVRAPVKINYLEREQNNRNLGLRGEEMALAYERNLLINAGKESLADRIEWVSQEQGDGLGFDILSKNMNGTDKYIEVKTTKLSKESPFYFTSNELIFSIKNESNFHLYRIYDFNLQPKMFNLAGRYDHFCNISPTQYKGTF